MKKMTSIVLSIVMAAFTLTSCATANSGNERTSTTTVATTKPAVTTQAATTTTVVTTAPATTTTAPATTTEEVTTTEEPLVKVSAPVDEQPMPIVEEPTVQNSVMLDVKNICQYPEFPMGGSVVSATIALNYYGFNSDKMALLQYMTISEEPDDNGLWGNPLEVFLGSPESYTLGYGSIPVIKNAMTAYLNANGGSSYKVVDLSGSSISDLYSEIDSNNPVIIWVTVSMADVQKGCMVLPLQNGDSFDCPANSHCVCLVGYNQENDSVILCDPFSMENTIEFPKSTVESVYDQMGKQALVIHKQ
jgi:uncharacterized protein YvpB